MFARTKVRDNKKHYPLQKCEVERSLTTVVQPIISNSVFARPLKSPSSQAFSPYSYTTTSTHRTGDNTSYYCSSSSGVTISRNAARRGFRILSYTEDDSGKIHLFDILDGHPYHCSRTTGKRITANAIVFESKDAALSERFPSNQVNQSFSSSK